MTGFWVIFLGVYALLAAMMAIGRAIAVDPITSNPAKTSADVTASRLGLLLKAATLLAMAAYLFGWWG